MASGNSSQVLVMAWMKGLASRLRRRPFSRSRSGKELRNGLGEKDAVQEAQCSPVDPDADAQPGEEEEEGEEDSSPGWKAVARGGSGTSTSSRDGLGPVQLERRQAEEKEFVRAHDTAESSVWYLVDVYWLQEWKQFVMQGGPMPGPIDNWRLLDERGQPRRGLLTVEHYRGVNASVWAYWHKRYGGGPELRRRTLDLYAPPLEDSRNGLQGQTQLDLSRDAQQALNEDVSSPVWLQRRQEAGSPVRGSRFKKLGSSTKNSSSEISDLVLQQSVRTGSGRAGSSRKTPPPRGTSAPATRNSTSDDGDEKKAVLCCDKCDGPHESKRCPHFRKPREKHADAWSSYGKSKSSKDTGIGAPFVASRNVRVIQQPGDGSCLFHSLSYGLAESNASMLRQDICSYIASNPGMTIADTALKDWIRYDSGGSVQSYAEHMAAGTWGGGIEMAALTRMKNVNVHVYEKCREGSLEGYRRISAFESPGAHKTVSVLYQGRMHYDAIVL